MARLIRPVRQWPLFRNHTCFSLSSSNLNSSPLQFSVSTESLLPGLSLATFPSSYRTAHHRPRRRKSPNALGASNIQEVDADDSDSDNKKSRNQKKREARQAVRWGMELVSFPTSHIKRILRAAKVDEHVYEALMTAKKLGSDVREGKRRQFNYVGKLLRDVEPELMNALIRATREGDQKMLQALAGSHAQNNAEDEDDDDEETVEEQDEIIVSIASRWFDGLISKDLNVTNEIYSLDSIDFDRQELRKLVRKVHLLRERHKEITDDRNKEDVKAAEVVEENVKAAAVVEENVKAEVIVEEDVKAEVIVEEDVKAEVIVEEDVKAEVIIEEDVKVAVVVKEDVKAAVAVEKNIKAAVVVKEDTKAAVEAAEASLSNFLRGLAKQIPTE